MTIEERDELIAAIMEIIMSGSIFYSEGVQAIQDAITDLIEERFG